jgi:hypothetical protein
VDRQLHYRVQIHPLRPGSWSRRIHGFLIQQFGPNHDDGAASVPDALKQCQRCQSLVLEWPTTPTLEPVGKKYFKDLGLQPSWSETCGTCQTFRTIIRDVAIDESAYLVPTLLSFNFLIPPPTTKEVKGWQVKGQKWVDKNQTINDCSWTNGAIDTILEHPNPDLISFVNIPNIRQWIDRCKITKDLNHRYCNRPLPRPPRNVREIFVSLTASNGPLFHNQKGLHIYR